MNVRRTLGDLVRGIRYHRSDEREYIQKQMQSIREELKSNDHKTKSEAVNKLIYLNMLGYDMNWASFHVVEVMSQPSFSDKRIGYMAASQSFHAGTEVILLTTSLLKRSFAVPNMYEQGLALNCLSQICTPDLARDLASDVVAALNNSKPYIRKRAILALYSIFLQFPEALRPAFPRLKDRLEDENAGCLSAAVSVICELARRNPRNYVSLAPTLFKIMTTSTSNWMLIKIVKLFASLCPLEPRLTKRLAEPLSNIINSTTAMSLLYECIQCCISGMHKKIPLMKLCISKLRMFVEDPDQNLKYLGLQALHNIMQYHPKAVSEHRELVIQCLEDADVSIRLRALDLLSGMVSRKNLVDVVERLLDHADRAEPDYRDQLIERIIAMCSAKDYANVADFEWYLADVLVEMARYPTTRAGAQIAAQMMDVIIRVEAVRDFGCEVMLSLLRDPKLLSSRSDVGGTAQLTLAAAAFCVGEYPDSLPRLSEPVELMLQPRALALPAMIQAVYLHNVLKLLAAALARDAPGAQADAEALLNAVSARLPSFTHSRHLEVQERACFLAAVLATLHSRRADGAALHPTLFARPLLPVASGAQARVPLPEGLDLDQPLQPDPVPRVGFFGDSDSDGGGDDDDDDGDWGGGRRRRGGRRGRSVWGDSDSASDDGFGHGAADDDDFDDDDGFFAQDAAQHQSSSSRPRHHRRERHEDRRERAKEREREARARRDEREANIFIIKDNGKKKRSGKPQHGGGSGGDDDAAGRHPRSGGPSESDGSPPPPVASLKELGIRDPFARRGSRSRTASRTKGAKVSTAFEAPDAPSSPNSANASPRGAAVPSPKAGIDADIDLTSPLRADEALPTPKHRTVQSQPASASPSAGSEDNKDQRRHRRHRRDDDGGDRRRKEKSERDSYMLGGSGGGKKKAEAAPPAAAAAAGGEGFRPLVAESDARAVYFLKADAKKPNMVCIRLMVNNAGERPLRDVRVLLRDSLTHSAVSGGTVREEIQRGESAKTQLILRLSSTAVAHDVRGDLAFDAGGEPRAVPFELRLTPLDFVEPHKLRREELVEFLNPKKPVGRELKLKSAARPLAGKDPRHYLKRVPQLLHVEVVERSKVSASYYGRTLFGQHILVLAKQRGADISIDVKCPDPALAQFLIDEFLKCEF